MRVLGVSLRLPHGYQYCVAEASRGRPMRPTNTCFYLAQGFLASLGSRLISAVHMGTESLLVPGHPLLTPVLSPDHAGSGF